MLVEAQCGAAFLLDERQRVAEVRNELDRLGEVGLVVRRQGGAGEPADEEAEPFEEEPDAPVNASETMADLSPDE